MLLILLVQERIILNQRPIASNTHDHIPDFPVTMVTVSSLCNFSEYSKHYAKSRFVAEDLYWLRNGANVVEDLLFKEKRKEKTNVS